MKIGYARVSTDEQNPDLQITALKNAGCELIYVDKASGAKFERLEFQKALAALSEGDVLVVWKLDRLTRSLADLLITLDMIGRRCAGFQSLTESIDTTTSSGRLMAQMIGSFAEFERSIIRERTIAGQQAAKKRGQLIGRRPKFNSMQTEEVLRMVSTGEKSMRTAAKLFGVAPSTVSRLLKKLPSQGSAIDRYQRLDQMDLVYPKS